LQGHSLLSADCTLNIFIKVEIQQLVHVVGDNNMQVDGLTPEYEHLKLAAFIATKIYSHLG
jgi:hypothetical protein